MAILVKPVSSPKEMKQFVYLPREIHRNHKGWVPPLYGDDFRVLDPKRNHAHTYCDSIYALAWENGKPVGRIAGIINRRYNEHMKVAHGRFGFMESPDNFEVTKAMLEFVEKWAREKGMEKLIGPMGFTEEDPEAFIIEGFDQVTNLATNQNLPYLLEHLDKLGYTKEIDYMVYKVDIKGAMTDFFRKIYERVSRSKEFKLLEFKNKRHLKQYIRPIFRLMNASFMELYGYSPLSEEEQDQLAQRYMILLDPRFIKAAITPENEVVGFIIGIPNIASGIIKAKGKLFPFGFLHILRASKHSTKLDTYLGAVKDTFRSKGVDAVIGYALLDSAHKAGFKILDSHHEMESNTKIRAEMERAGGVIYKKYRIFQKELSAKA